MSFIFERAFSSPIPLLRPLGSFWGWLMELRRKGYESGFFSSAGFEKPVVSVGNVTLGGNGKTPMCVFLAKALAEKGLRPAILSRGYGRGAVRGHPEPILVSRGEGPMIPAAESGDEPFLMALKTGSIVALARKRALAASLAIKEGADVLILDDGFQHLALKRDLDILMLRADQRLDDGLIIPAGYLRERASAHLRADILVAIGDVLNEYLLRLANGRPIFLAKMVPSGLTGLADRGAVSPEGLKGKRLGAFCGLARPTSFFKSLHDMGVMVSAHLCLPDHVKYDPGTINRLGKFKDLNRLDHLLTSAKDAVKLPRSLPLPIITLESDLTLDRPNAFLAETLSRLS
ncbi:MAG: tetraacyldisaccharide 4'-kinase [Deltaproteobacteria bacterium]|jgi:tetraacyldisaccharide 4'-kinase|nr:tetraacyldisaccharide 4'-kinase [Deltaproteobacteria bacterium]